VVHTIKEAGLNETITKERADVPGSIANHRHVLLLDGVCNLCSGFLHFVLKHERDRDLTFCWVQSQAGSEILRWVGLPADEYDTMVYVRSGSHYIRSTAFLEVARHFRFPWRIVRICLVVPRVVRDRLYDQIAGKRYAMFGRTPECTAPTGDLLRRFVH